MRALNHHVFDPTSKALTQKRAVDSSAPIGLPMAARASRTHQRPFPSQRGGTLR
jgi:hypothetical protein